MADPKQFPAFDIALTPLLQTESPSISGKTQGESARCRPKSVHRSIFLSDMHLGTRMSRPDLILEFLDTHTAETVYLVGDIVDNWHPLSRNWKSAHHQVLIRLLDLPQTGTRVVFIPGNHDAFFRNYVGTTFGGIEVRRQAVHQAANGLLYLLKHGDCCDIFAARTPIIARAGSLVEKLAGDMDAAQRHLLRKLGRPEWRGIERLIARTNAAIRKHDRFEERLTDLAIIGGYDGIICGHFHQPALYEAKHVIYANCGDWTGNNTAIVESFDGRLEILTVPEKTAADQRRETCDDREGELALAN